MKLFEILIGVDAHPIFGNANIFDKLSISKVMLPTVFL